MTEAAGDVHGLLEHDHGEGNSGDPGDEADNAEHPKNGKHNCCRVIVLDEIVDGCPESEDNVQNSCYPDELLRERTRSEKIRPGDNESDHEHKDEEDQCISV